MERLAEINPLYLLGLAALGYIAVLLFRYRLGQIMLLAWTIGCAYLLLSSPGKAVIDSAQQLPSGVERAHCVIAAGAGGGLWNAAVPAKTPACRFDGFSATGGEPGQRSSEIRATRDYMINTYGR